MYKDEYTKTMYTETDECDFYTKSGHVILILVPFHATVY